MNHILKPGVMSMNFSCLSHLECSLCHRLFAADQIQTFCPQCTAPLLVRYDLQSVRENLSNEEFAERPRGMWRWHELLPIKSAENMVYLGEGDTPLLKLPRLGAQLGLPNLLLKDEAINPTGTFKARGQAAAVSKARELGIEKLIIPTAGNAGGALAAYAAFAGLTARVVMPADSPRANVGECRAYGAEVDLVDGLISDAARQAGAASRTEGWFDMSTFKEPYRLEGKKIMGYELAEALDWHLPDVLLYPAGGGMGLAGIWKAFDELEQLGWIAPGKRPRMVAVQAEGCAPFVRAFEQRQAVCEFWQGAHTAASGLRVPKSFGDRLVLAVLYESHGTAVAVSDEVLLEAVRSLGSLEGIFAAPEGGALVAALPPMLRSGWLSPDETVVLINTGSGLKYL